MHSGICINDKNVTLKVGERRHFGTLCSTNSVIVHREQVHTMLPTARRGDNPTAIDVRLDPVTGALVTQVQTVSRGMASRARAWSARRTRGGLLGLSADVIINNTTPVAIACKVKVGILCKDKDVTVAAGTVANIVNNCTPEHIQIILNQKTVLSPTPKGSAFSSPLVEVTETNGVLKLNGGGTSR
jgi:hypothetical protein